MTKTPRTYRQITPAIVAEHKALRALHGNGSAAVRAAESTRLGVKQRAFRIRTKENQQNTNDFIDDQLQQIGVDAINRIGKLINSVDERIATSNSHYVVDHIRGQAVKRSISVTGKINIQNALD